jgi:tetratricopeptide (TPR) repeat protein
MEPTPMDRGRLERISAGTAPMETADPGLVYDDEPLDHILYGTGIGGPTPASLFMEAGKHLADMRAACELADTQAVIHAAAILGADAGPVSVRMCFEITHIMTQVVPQIPDPIMPFDLSLLQTLLEKVWKVALEKNHKALQKRAGAPLFRWYEHRRNYEDARGVLNRLIEVYVDEADRSDKAVATNNLAFEYYLEGRVHEAIPGFQAAAGLFEALGDAVQQANSLANAWMCRMACGDLADAGQAECELQRLAETLSHAGSWQVRKPLIMLARIAEHQGKLESAAALVKRAIEACAGSNTRYPEMDAGYLRQLECRSACILEAKSL